jgi:hypothetical protein
MVMGIPEQLVEPRTLSIYLPGTVSTRQGIMILDVRVSLPGETPTHS